MRVIEVKQSARAHDGNQLHDEMIAAGLQPYPVYVHDDRTEFHLPDADEPKARQVIARHEKKERPKPPDRKTLVARVRAAKPGTVELRDAIAEALEALL